MIRRSRREATAICRGRREVQRVYRGRRIVWEREQSITGITSVSIVRYISTIRGVTEASTDPETGETVEALKALDITMTDTRDQSTVTERIAVDEMPTVREQVIDESDALGAVVVYGYRDDGSNQEITSYCEVTFSDNAANELYWIASYTDEFGCVLTDQQTCVLEGLTVCLSGDTRITMADGREKRLDEIRVGDLVLASDGSATRVVKVKSGSVSPLHTMYSFENGTVIDETGTHRFYNAEQGFWQHLCRWKLGEHAMMADGTETALISVRRVEEDAEQFGLWTESRDYYANGLLSGDAGANEPLLKNGTPELAARMAASLTEDDMAELAGWESFMPGRTT